VGGWVVVVGAWLESDLSDRLWVEPSLGQAEQLQLKCLASTNLIVYFLY
jgi:hypothetical protein